MYSQSVNVVRMTVLVMWVLQFLFVTSCGWAVVSASNPDDDLMDPAARQLPQFKHEHKQPIGALTLSSGSPVDVTQINTLNDDIFSNEYYIDSQRANNQERIPERFVHAIGTGAHGFFEVLHDVSKYTKIDAFNGVGKKTPILARLSSANEHKGGSDLERDLRGFAVKFYTKEGNLDLIGLHIPVFSVNDPSDFVSFQKSNDKNPKTGLDDATMAFDFLTLRPAAVHGFLWVESDFGIPRGYRKMDVFMQHAFEIYNEHGDKYYARFNFRTEQGLENFTSAEAADIRSRDLEYFTRDLYNAIESKDYPSWILEMDVLSEHELKTIDFNPFDLTKLWPKGSYKTVPIGRLTLNRNVDNQFSEVEVAAFCPLHLVPGITGAPDNIFRARRALYLESIRNRIGPNHKKIEINLPWNAKTYNRDGLPPVGKNMKDAPNYFPNSFNGPQPVVDTARPRAHLKVRASNAVDLQQAADFYNHVLTSEGERQRLADNIGAALVTCTSLTREKALKLFKQIDLDLGRRVVISLAVAEQQAREQAALMRARDAASKAARIAAQKDNQQNKNDDNDDDDD